MKIGKGDSAGIYSEGTVIELTGDEVALAIDSWVYSQGVVIDGARTVRVNEVNIESAYIYVDPSGRVIKRGEVLS